MKPFAYLALALLLLACEGQTIVEHRVENASSRTVRMLFHADVFHGFQPDTVVLQPGTFTRVAWNDLRGGRPGYRRPAEGIDSVFVSVDGGGTLTRDLLHDDNWAVDSKGRRAPARWTHICTFTFADGDIE
ncbi:MAG: hypothetical protein KDB88_09115 [Flavobacteriales bacterium]|nr:hypothetical protein [Flavobacteriales bacterium]